MSALMQMFCGWLVINGLIVLTGLSVVILWSQYGEQAARYRARRSPRRAITAEDRIRAGKADARILIEVAATFDREMSK